MPDHDDEHEMSDALDLELYGDVGDFWGDGSGFTAVDVSEALHAAGDTLGLVTLRINSGGGDAFEGLAIYNVLAQHKARVEVVIDGLAASAASIIAMAGDKITMAENAMMMIHCAWGMSIGNAEDMRGTADMLEKIDTSLAGIYAARTGMKPERCSDMMAAETWMSAKEAKTLGFCDATTPNKKTPSKASAALRHPFRNAPREQLAALGFELKPTALATRRAGPVSPELPTQNNARPPPAPALLDDAFGPDGTPRSSIQAAEQVILKLASDAALSEPERALAVRWARDLRASVDNIGTPLSPLERALMVSWTDQALAAAFDTKVALSRADRELLASLARFALAKARAENLIHAPAAHLDPPNTQPRIGDCL